MRKKDLKKKEKHKECKGKKQEKRLLLKLKKKENK